MSNVHPIRPIPEQTILELATQLSVYREACLDLCDLVMSLAHPFGTNDWEKKVDRIRAMCE